MGLRSLYTNKMSINEGKEYGSYIYQISGDSQYYYAPYHGSGNTVEGRHCYHKSTGSYHYKTKSKFLGFGCSCNPKERIVADLHTHGNYNPTAVNNSFSKRDIDVYTTSKMNGYVATPDGRLQKFEHSSTKTTTTSNFIHYDTAHYEFKTAKFGGGTPASINKLHRHRVKIKW